MPLAALTSLLAGCGAAAEPPPPRGFIVVSMDTLRADHLSPWGAPPGASPTLGRLAEESVVFERAYAQANETLLSHGSLFTSRIPSHVAPVDYDFTIPAGMPTLASEMSAAGYRTGAVVASGHLARVFGLDDGFADYVEGAWMGSFQETVPMAVRWLGQAKEEGQPFFLFLHGYDCHTPYVKPGPFARLTTPGYDGFLLRAANDPMFYERVFRGDFFPRFPLERLPNAAGTKILSPGVYDQLPIYAAEPSNARIALAEEDLDYVRGTYRSAVLYADLWMGVFLDEVEKLGMLETTTIVVVSDHGEALLQYDFFSHRHTLRDAATHVPVMIRPPGGLAGGRRVTGPISLLDVAPTVLTLAGAPIPAGMEGRSLVACLTGDCAGKPAYSEAVLEMASVTDGRWRLVVDGAPVNTPELDARIDAEGGFQLYDGEEAAGPDHAGDATLRPVVEALRSAMRDTRRAR